MRRMRWHVAIKRSWLSGVGATASDYVFSAAPASFGHNRSGFIVKSMCSSGALRRYSQRPAGLDARSIAGVLALLSIAFATYLAIRFAGQPLLERHGFRQTQTALSAFWIARDGFHLDYETPVVGFPWDIPFEFPLFQGLVALIYRLTGFPLDATGRLLSFAFLVACLAPARLIGTRLGLSPLTRATFVVLLFTSPQYLFWGRAFMIETAALFFSLAFIPFAIDILRREKGWLAPIAACAAMTMALLVKATTALPVLAVLGVAWLATLRTRRPGSNDLLAALAAFAVPLTIGTMWVNFTDAVKLHNPIGASLTSQALSAWNFGTLQQRISPQLWKDVILAWGIGRNAGSALGGTVLLAALLWPTPFPRRKLVIAALCLYLLPLLMFTNLQIVHDYYQTSCVIFLIAALSIAIGEWLPQFSRRAGLSVLIMSAAAIINVIAFASSGYAAALTASLGENPKLAVAHFVREHVPYTEPVVIYGLDWSSEVAYYAERRALTVPPWFYDYQRTWTEPEQFLGGVSPGAFVICPSRTPPTSDQVNERLLANQALRAQVIAGCLILYRPEQKPEAAGDAPR